MTPTEIRATLRRLGWSQAAAARRLGIGLSTVAHAVAEPPTAALPVPALRLLRLADTIPEAREALERLAA